MALVKTGSLDGCENLTCPGIWTETTDGSVEVQGLTTTRAGLPDGESRVRMSAEEFSVIARRHLGLA